MKNQTLLLVLCTAALVLSILATLYVFLLGAFFLFKIGAGLCLLFIILLIVILKERRIHRLMNEDDYDRERDAI